jgi:nitric oxide dioxygenase
LVSRIKHRHCALSILPEHYGIVHENLMIAIGDVLGDAVTPEVRWE